MTNDLANRLQEMFILATKLKDSHYKILFAARLAWFLSGIKMYRVA